MTSKAKATKAKADKKKTKTKKKPTNNKWVNSKLKSFCMGKETIIKVKLQPEKQEKSIYLMHDLTYLQIVYLIRNCYLKHMKDSVQYNNKNKKKQIVKSDLKTQRVSEYLSLPKKIYR